MKNRQEIKGKQIADAIKDNVGNLINDRDLAAEGRAERCVGRMRQTIGKPAEKSVRG